MRWHHSLAPAGGSQLDLATVPPQEKDVLELDYGDVEKSASELLISEAENEDDIFITLAQAVQPAASVAPPSPLRHLSGWR